MAVSFAVSLVAGVALMMTDVGRQALVDQMERTALAFGREVDDTQYARFRELSERGALYAAGRAVVAGPVLAFGAAAVIFVALGQSRGPRASYRQVLAVTAHAGLILALRDAVAAPIHYSRETLASPATMALIAPMVDGASPAGRFLGAIDLFVVWWLVVLAVGAALLYRRRAGWIAAAFLGAYVGVAALLAIAMVLSGGTV
jgi:Yip1 domain